VDVMEDSPSMQAIYLNHLIANKSVCVRLNKFPLLYIINRFFFSRMKRDFIDTEIHK
jgi:hypothetical protein